MIEKSSVLISLLLLCVVFAPARSDPMQKYTENQASSTNRQSRTFSLNWFTTNHWPQFRQIWRLPTLPTISASSAYANDQSYENFHKRITDLENGQRRIINYIRKLNTDKNANGSDGNNSAPMLEHLPTTPIENFIVPSVASTDAEEISPEPQISTIASTTVDTADYSLVNFWTTTVATRLRDEETETISTIGNVASESSSAKSEKLGDNEAEQLALEITTVSEELSKGVSDEEINEESTASAKIQDSEKMNEIFV